MAFVTPLKQEKELPHTREHLRTLVGQYFWNERRIPKEKIEDGLKLNGGLLRCDEWDRAKLCCILGTAYRSTIPSHVLYLSETLDDLFHYIEEHIWQVKPGPRLSPVEGTVATPQNTSELNAHLQLSYPPFRDGVGPKTVVFFPGQGAQKVGMCQAVYDDLPIAKEMFAIANSILGYDLLSICSKGPEQRLNSTVYAQPAVFMSSMIGLEKMKRDNPVLLESCTATAGLSLGEYSALVFAGAMTFPDALRVIKVRAENMQKAADASPQSMVAILRLDDKIDQVIAEASKKGPIQIANLLCPGNKVLSGSKEACEEAAIVGKRLGAVRATVLAVAGAFHTDYMSSAATELEQVLRDVPISKPRIPVYSNVDAQTHDNPEDIRQTLVKQLTNTVRWEQTVNTFLDLGVSRFQEIGTGNVLTGLAGHVHRNRKTQTKGYEAKNFPV